MINPNDFAINDIEKVEMWCDVPYYEKIDIKYVLILLLQCINIYNFERSRSKDELLFYLKKRKRNNEKYKKFWSDTSNKIFNDDKTQYVCFTVTAINDFKME